MIVAMIHFSWRKFVPYDFKCPRCGEKQKLYWRKHWNLNVDSLTRGLIAVYDKSRLGDVMLRRFPMYNVDGDFAKELIPELVLVEPKKTLFERVFKR